MHQLLRRKHRTTSAGSAKSHKLEFPLAIKRRRRVTWELKGKSRRVAHTGNFNQIARACERREIRSHSRGTTENTCMYEKIKVTLFFIPILFRIFIIFIIINVCTLIYGRFLLPTVAPCACVCTKELFEVENFNFNFFADLKMRDHDIFCGYYTTA